ncbi:protein yellow-like [Cloeon dipterum]|uniref:protein yellow-like n=1 Tax=Cloeon dipterum TaxID=197152 RepID=UPI00322068B0
MSPLFAAIFLLGLSVANAINFKTVYQWDKLDYVWPSEASSSIERIKQNFKPEDVALEFMAVFRERLFLSLRIKSGIPVTLVSLPITSTAPPKLAPFPSWDLHKLDKCDTIQRAYGMEVDTEGRLWLLDNGSGNCNSKLWIFDLLNNDTIERVHKFPDIIVSYSTGAWMHDIALDKTSDDYLAYITDSFSEHLIVYSRKMDKSWSVKTPERKWQYLALSPSRESLYLIESIGSKDLYSVSVSELKNGGGRAAVKFIGEFARGPFRMLIDNANILYAAFYGQNYISKWNISEPFREQRFYEIEYQGADRPFAFALDTNGTLWMTVRSGFYSEKKHKLIKAAVGTRSQ